MHLTFRARRNFLKTVCFGAGTALVSAYPFFIERYLFRVNTYEIPLPRLPAAFEGFTIVQLTDIHYGFLMPMTAVRHVVKTANALEKDIVVCTGDYIHERNSTAQIDAVWPELSQLQAPKGVYSVLGNHDHWGDTDRSLAWLTRSGQNLRHRSVAIEKQNQRIWLGGAGDFWEDAPGIDLAFEGVPSGECKILLCHNPDSADTDYKRRIDLMICGHTHGGQVVIPFWGPPVLPVSNKRYSSGLIDNGKTKLFISRGLGWAIIPIRLNCLPEIAVLKLKRDVA
jgi:predicted MPP superfamily phosphohydrolase